MRRGSRRKIEQDRAKKIASVGLHDWNFRNQLIKWYLPFNMG